MIVSYYDSPIGRLLLADRNGELAGLWIVGQKYFPELPRDAAEGETELLIKTKTWLDRYFAGKKPEISELPLAPEGSDFRQEVWQILCEIPCGKVTTYGRIAAKLAARRGIPTMSAQAVGGAVGHNPISIVIPCHRVVGTDGSLTGYAGGIERKRWLLEFENALGQSGGK